MEALRRRVGDEGAKKAGQEAREMLMPIAGKKSAKETAAKKPAARSRQKSA
jgi:DNA end-binding protein Ku